MLQDIFINGGLYETRLALMQADRLVECRHLPFGAADGFQPLTGPVSGSLCLGRITRVAPELEAAFVDIGFEMPGFLPASAIEVATAGQSLAGRVREGQLLAVLVVKPGYDGKGPRLNACLSPEQEALTRPHLQAGAKSKPGPVPGSLPGLAEAVTGLIGETPIGNIHIDHPAAFALLQAEGPAPLGDALQRAATGDLFTAHGIDEQIEAALEPVQPLPGGGTLIIEPTSALTAIDVNSGAMTGSALRQRLNMEAANAIPPALRLRGIGGQVVIDFLPMRGRTPYDAVLAALKQACRGDRAQIKISRMTTGGLVALTRERRAPSLAAQLLGPQPRPAPSLPAQAAANRLMQALAGEARQPGSRNFLIRTAPELLHWLQARGEFELAVQREFGINPVFQADDSLQMNQWKWERT